MVDTASCHRCSSPVQPGASFCANCGAMLVGAPDPPAAAEPQAAYRPPEREVEPKPETTTRLGAKPSRSVGSPTEAASIAEGEPLAAPKPQEAVEPAPDANPAPEAALEFEVAPAPETDPVPALAPELQVAPVPRIAPAPAVAPELQVPPVPRIALAPEAAIQGADPPGRLPGGYLPPSGTYRAPGWAPPERDPMNLAPRPAGPSLSVSVGAVPVTSNGAGTPSRPIPTAPSQLGAPAMATVPPAATFGVVPGLTPVSIAPTAQARASVPGSLSPLDGSLPAAPSPQSAAVAGTSATAEPTRKETVQELVAFGLVAAGGVVGLASFFLPWAGTTGIGIGTVATGASLPPPNQWAWAMPAAIPVFLLTALVLGAAVGSDRAQQRLPVLAPTIARLTEIVLPMLLAGVFFGVGLLYVTLPYGYGTGIFVLMGGGCLLLAGSIVTLFFPVRDESGAA